MLTPLELDVRNGLRGKVAGRRPVLPRLLEGVLPIRWAQPPFPALGLVVPGGIRDAL